MRNLARGLAGLIALLFLVFGGLYMFAAEGRMDAIGLAASSDQGLATVRAFIGGGFLTFGILLVVHTVINQETGALRFSILFLLLSIVGRVVSLISDGSGGDAVRNFVPVVVMLAVSVISLRLFLQTENA